MEVVYALEPTVSKPRISLFLAGPSPRGSEDYNWRLSALDFLESMCFAGTIFVPLPRDGQYNPDYDHNAQVDWELDHLEMADAIAFWIPRSVKNLPGFTTNVEFGLFARSKKIVLGYPPGAEKMKYLHRVAERFEIQICDTMQHTITLACGLATQRASA